MFSQLVLHFEAVTLPILLGISVCSCCKRKCCLVKVFLLLFTYLYVFFCYEQNKTKMRTIRKALIPLVEGTGTPIQQAENVSRTNIFILIVGVSQVILAMLLLRNAIPVGKTLMATTSSTAGGISSITAGGATLSETVRNSIPSISGSDSSLYSSVADGIVP